LGIEKSDEKNRKWDPLRMRKMQDRYPKKKRTSESLHLPRVRSRLKCKQDEAVLVPSGEDLSIGKWASPLFRGAGGSLGHLRRTERKGPAP